MQGLFSKRNTRIALALVLALTGLTMVIAPNGIQWVIGGNIYLYMGLVGAGFTTAAVISYRIMKGVPPKRAAYEGFLTASILALLVIAFNFRLRWAIPGLAAVLIAYLSAKGLSDSAS